MGRAAKGRLGSVRHLVTSDSWATAASSFRRAQWRFALTFRLSCSCGRPFPTRPMTPHATEANRYGIASTHTGPSVTIPDPASGCGPWQRVWAHMAMLSPVSRCVSRRDLGTPARNGAQHDHTATVPGPRLSRQATQQPPLASPGRDGRGPAAGPPAAATADCRLHDCGLLDWRAVVSGGIRQPISTRAINQSAIRSSPRPPAAPSSPASSSCRPSRRRARARPRSASPRRGTPVRPRRARIRRCASRWAAA